MIINIWRNDSLHAPQCCTNPLQKFQNYDLLFNVMVGCVRYYAHAQTKNCAEHIIQLLR